MPDRILNFGRRPGMTLAVLVWWWAIPFAMIGARAAETPASTGEAAWARIIGNTIEGTTPDGPYSEFVLADGRLSNLDRDGPAEGRWTLSGGQICIRLADEDEDECRAIEVTGQTGAFVDQAGARYPFEILTGNPKNL